MTFLRRSALFFLLLPLLFSSPAQAESWPKIKAALAGWNGPRQVTLRTDRPDPLADADIQELLELLLDRGFVVIPAAPGTKAAEGLLLDERGADDDRVLALSRATDGAIIAFERRGVPKAKTPQPQVPPKPPAEPAMQLPAREQPRTESRELPAGPIELSGSPNRLALLGAADRGIDLVVQSGPSLQSLRLDRKGLHEVAKFKLPSEQLRPLHLDVADLDGDGEPEIAGLWAEDIGSIYQGTDSLLHAWIFTSKELGPQPASPDLGGFVRLVGSQGFVQKRGGFVLFKGPVFPLLKDGKGFVAGEQPVPWAGRDLYGATPLDAEEALAWDAKDRLQVVSLATGDPQPGALLLADFGNFHGPEVAVRLENPEYRSGFQKEDQVKERWHSLPRRLSIGADGAAYMVARGRSAGLPLLGKTSGQDALVRIVRDGQGLRLEHPFAGVEAFILDFALVVRPDSPDSPLTALLLINEKEDGSGKAWLLVRESE